MRKPFKKGDKVIRFQGGGHNGMSIGDIGVVQACRGDKGSYLVDILKENGCLSEGHDANNIKLSGKKAGRKQKVNFLLRYELEEDPIEEFSTIELVKARIKEPVDDKDNNGLQLDSIRVYKIEYVREVSVETSTVIKGL